MVSKSPLRITRETILTSVRKLMGTPYQHQARLPGVALDCIGLIIATAKDIGIQLTDCTAYPKYADGIQLLKNLDANMQIRWKKKDKKDRPALLLPGMIMAFWIAHPSRPTHVGIVTDYGIIHTNSKKGEVVEHVLDEPWLRRLVAVYDFPGVSL